jgi:hypothetical protein
MRSIRLVTSRIVLFLMPAAAARLSSRMAEGQQRKRWRCCYRITRQASIIATRQQYR